MDSGTQRKPAGKGMQGLAAGGQAEMQGKGRDDRIRAGAGGDYVTRLREPRRNPKSQHKLVEM